MTIISFISGSRIEVEEDLSHFDKKLNVGAKAIPVNIVCGDPFSGKTWSKKGVVFTDNIAYIKEA